MVALCTGFTLERDHVLLMLLGVAASRNGVPIRLSSERWTHIVEAHDYMAGLHEWVLEAVADPDAIVAGAGNEFIATQHRDETPIGAKDVVVAYREVSPEDGFVITAFMTSQVGRIHARGVLWKRST